MNESLINYNFRFSNFGNVVLHMAHQKGGDAIAAYITHLISTADSEINFHSILDPNKASSCSKPANFENISHIKEKLFTQGFVDLCNAVEQSGSVVNVQLPILSELRENNSEELKKVRFTAIRNQIRREILNQLQISYINGFLFAQYVCKSPKKNLTKILDYDHACSELLDKKQNYDGNYFIKQGYICNNYSPELLAASHEDIDDSRKYSVYLKAKELVMTYNLKSVLDIGCGMGLMLKELIFPTCHNITGIDSEKIITECKRMHDFGKWHAYDLNNEKIKLDRTFDLIIASDVIDHLNNPDNLLDIITRHSNCNTFIVLSTPERNLNAGVEHVGPPPDITRIREWNFYEFKDYIKSTDFHIIEHFLVSASQMDSAHTTAIMKSAGGTQIMVLSRPLDKTADPIISFFMIVTNHDILIADYTIRSYSLITDFKFKLIVYSNWVSAAYKEKFFEKWRQFDYVEIIDYPWLNDNDRPQDDPFYGIEGPYEKCESIWDRELKRIHTQFYATVDADFEILDPIFISVILKQMEDNPNIAAVSTDKTITGPYEKDNLMLNERLDTWFCIYRRATLKCSVSHFFYSEELPPGSPYVSNAWDSSGIYQKALKDIYNYDLAVLDRSYHSCFIHYGAFSKHKGISETNIEQYRILNILSKIGHKNILPAHLYDQYCTLLKRDLRHLNIPFDEGQSLSNLAKTLYYTCFLAVDKLNPYK
jgi:2-polyprenyl-3-methyl-5-hydroxy-6-metoxy-1,4-benzoquinol methylase